MSAVQANTDRTGFAISMILFGTVIITVSDLISKTIIPHLSIWQLLFLRSILGLALLMSILLSIKKTCLVKPHNMKSVLVRSSLMNVCYIFFYVALAHVPIAIAAGAFFCGPLFMVILSRFMLGEDFGIWRVGCLIVGFIGVMLVIKPLSSEFDPLLILGLFSAFFYALTQVTTRKYCKKESPVTLSFWLTIVFMVVGAIGMLFLWMFPSLVDSSFLRREAALMPLEPFLLLCVSAVCAIIMHFALSAAYQNAPSTLVAPLEYLYLPLAALGGFVFYKEVPDATVLIGITLIILAGLVVIWRKDSA